MAEIYVFDFETTGVNPKKDRPVQIGLLQVLDQRRHRILMNMLVDPCTSIPQGATAVHGITDKMVEGHPDYLAGLYLMGLFLSDVELRCSKKDEQVILMGFNSSAYDAPLADACIGVPLLSKYLQLDVFDVALRHFPDLPSKKLGYLYAQFLGVELIGAHGAIQDCIGTARLLQAMCEKLNTTPLDLAKELQEPVVYDIMPIGKHSGLEIDNVPTGWARWMKSNAKDIRPDLQKTINYILHERDNG